MGAQNQNKPPEDPKKKAEQEAINKTWQSCVASMKEIQTALERYKKDKGVYPSSLRELVPAYLNGVPNCPMGMQDTYSSSYLALDAGKRYLFYCNGHYHKNASIPVNYPVCRNCAGIEVQPGRAESRGIISNLHVPTSPKALYQQGMALYNAGEFYEALETLEKALATGKLEYSDEKQAQKTIHAIKKMPSDKVQAVEKVDNTANLDSLSPEDLFLRGITSYYNQNYQDAGECLNRAVRSQKLTEPTSSQARLIIEYIKEKKL